MERRRRIIFIICTTFVLNTFIKHVLSIFLNSNIVSIISGLTYIAAAIALIYNGANYKK